MRAFTESVVEDAALDWLHAIGWQIAYGPDIAPDMPAAERASYGEVVLGARLRDALLPKLVSDELRLPAALRNRAAQAGVTNADKFIKRAA